MKIPQYDIFSGSKDRDAIWLEAVEGLAAAVERMKDLANQSPGPYFVFGQDAREVLASVDTSIPQDTEGHQSHSA